MALLPLDGPSATLAQLAAMHGSRFTFRCQPCNHMVTFSGEEIVARYKPEVLFKHFQRRVICGHCRMPVDGDFRTMEFSSTEYLHKIAQAGGTGGGWSGPNLSPEAPPSPEPSAPA